MNLSVFEWLASFVLDVLIKSALFVFAGVVVFADMVVDDSTNPFGLLLRFVLNGIGFSILHFGCLTLGYTAAVALEPAGRKLRPSLKFWLGVLFANALFGAVVNILLTLEVAPTAPQSVFELSPVTVALVATNLLPVLVVHVYACIVEYIKRHELPTPPG
jgi:hypothetical protein